MATKFNGRIAEHVAQSETTKMMLCLFGTNETTPPMRDLPHKFDTSN